jgi:putative Mg2+ transporter-C (MgtC) family protein
MKLAAPGETARTLSQVVMGVGFLGAAVIIRDGKQVRGLNTAVTIWCSAAIGAIAGAQLYGFAATGAAVIVVANLLMHILEHRCGLFAAARNEDDKQGPAGT